MGSTGTGTTVKGSDNIDQIVAQLTDSATSETVRAKLFAAQLSAYENEKDGADSIHKLFDKILKTTAGPALEKLFAAAGNLEAKDLTGRNLPHDKTALDHVLGKALLLAVKQTEIIDFAVETGADAKSLQEFSMEPGKPLSRRSWSRRRR